MQEVDYCCISDNYWLGKNKPCLTYGLRGVCYFFIEVECATKDLHSGVFGGTVHEGMVDLMWMMNQLVDGEGNILVEGLMDTVAPLTAEESAKYDNIDFDVDVYRLKRCRILRISKEINFQDGSRCTRSPYAQG